MYESLTCARKTWQQGNFTEITELKVCIDSTENKA